MSPTSNWTIGASSIGSAILLLASTTAAIPEPEFPESISFDWTLVAAPPEQREAFGSCSAPHPSLNLTGHEPLFGIGRYEGTDQFLVPPAQIELATCADFGPPPVEPPYVFGADASANPIEKPKAGTRYRWRCFLFADLRGVRFFSAGEIFVS